MPKYTDEDIRNMSKITCKIAADYLGISPMACILCSRPCHGRTCLYLFQLGGAGCNHRPPDKMCIRDRV